MGRKMRALCLNYRKGWTMHAKFSGRKVMIRELRKLKQEGLRVVSIRLGGLASSMPYAIMVYNKKFDVRLK